jgi:hypothetical protein
MTFVLTVLETGVHHDIPFPPWAFGVIAFVLLCLMLLVTLALGKGRPHS